MCQAKASWETEKYYYVKINNIFNLQKIDMCWHSLLGKELKTENCVTIIPPRQIVLLVFNFFVSFPENLMNVNRQEGLGKEVKIQTLNRNLHLQIERGYLILHTNQYLETSKAEEKALTVHISDRDN